MTVRELMSAPVEACNASDDLATVAMIMWWRDCGAIPVTEDGGPKVVGMITDRDICMAVATRHCAPDEIRAADVVNRRLHPVGPDDAVETALERMAEAQVRRLPVLADDGTAVGLLSLNDIILHTGNPRSRSRSVVHADAVLRTLKAVSEHRAEAEAVAAGEPEPA